MNISISSICVKDERHEVGIYHAIMHTTNLIVQNLTTTAYQNTFNYTVKLIKYNQNAQIRIIVHFVFHI